MSEPQPASEFGAEHEAERLGAALRDVQSRIERACERARRDPREVEILAVTKTVPAERLRVASDLGLTHFAENRVQEAESKIGRVPGATWQMIGRLQSNKAARAVELFEAIHSLDSVALAERIDRLARQRHGEHKPGRYAVYLQVNVDEDQAKTGFAREDLRRALARFAELGALEIRGLMTVGRLVATPEDARTTFRALRELSTEIRQSHAAIGAGLSMGMSDDFEIAVEEGATVVRLGRALFGERVAR